ncbi:hypothetical protein I3F58_28860 [Streptomyces sp. MUM 203J]|nr:hypothetical protein [Streptomyces sp. MUM 203J]
MELAKAPSPAPRTRASQGWLRWAPAAGALVLLVGGAAVVANGTAGSGSGSGGGGNRPVPAASSSPAPEGPALSTDAHIWSNGCDHRYLLDRTPGTVPPPPVQQDARSWAARLAAVDGDRSMVRATVTAPEDGPVVVQRLSVRVVERRAPLDRPGYVMSPGCGGAVTPAHYAVDLDKPRPLAHAQDGTGIDDKGGLHTLPAPHLPFQVTRDAPLVLLVQATTTRCDCDWYLEAEWTRGDRRGTLRIDDEGRPFRTSGSTSDRQYYYATEDEAWTAF